MGSFERKRQVETKTDRIKHTVGGLNDKAIDRGDMAKVVQDAITEAFRINEKNGTSKEALSVHGAIAEALAQDIDAIDPVALAHVGVDAAVAAIATSSLPDADKVEIIRDFKAIVKSKFEVRTPSGARVNLSDPRY